MSLNDESKFAFDTDPSELSKSPLEHSPSTVHFQPPQRDGGEITLGRYVLLRVIGQGGMGQVWLAHDPVLDRDVAIKVTRQDRGLGTDGVAIFLDEGRNLGKLRHRNILQVFDCGFENGVCYLVAEYVQGGTLVERLAKGKLSYQTTAHYVAQIADAAHYAHLQGLVHRDIKPANILMRSSAEPILADFGLAVTEQAQLSESNCLVGTYAYMSPEQLRGESHLVDGRADVYSLGVVLYLMLTERLPFVSGDPQQYRDLMLKRDARPPRSICDDIPAELEAICLKCLARNTADRYSTAADLAAALRNFGQPVAKQSAKASWIAGTLITALCAAILLWIGSHWLPAPIDSQPSAPAVPVSPTIEPTVAKATEPPVAKVDIQEVAPAAPVSAAPPPSDARTITVSTRLQPANVPATWDISSDGQTLRFFGDDLVLLEIGDVADEDVDFSVEISQKKWEGGIGLFWAYAEDEQRPEWRSVEHLQLYPGTGDKRKLRGVSLMYPELASYLSQETEWGTAMIPKLNDRAQRIGLSFRGGQLSDLTWNDQSQKSLLQQRAKRFQPHERAQGKFGLFAYGSHGSFGQPRLNGRDVRFAE
ncbi:serine/threonine protein kinase [Anatilimnocola sp. NA78]|uniref:serine/threonine protein kinase n=1 Tax=Anatilimnocola sp. NA78 TaxID=3415683 RepID=UPI003CE525B6